MEQLTQLYDANIGEPYFNLEESNHDKKSGLTQGQLNSFILKLLTTIDLPKLAELYFQQLQNTLPLSELKIQFEDNRVCLARAEKILT